MANVNAVLNENLRLWSAAHSNDWDIPVLEIYRDYTNIERFLNDNEGEDVFEVIDKAEEDFEATSEGYDEVVDVSRDIPVPGKKGWYYAKSGTGIRLKIFEGPEKQFDKVLRSFLHEISQEEKVGTANGESWIKGIVEKDASLSKLEKLVSRRKLESLLEDRVYGGMKIEREALERIRRSVIDQYMEAGDRKAESDVFGNILIEEMMGVNTVSKEDLEKVFTKACERAWLVYPKSMSLANLREWANKEFEEKKNNVILLYSMLKMAGAGKREATGKGYDGEINSEAVKEALNLTAEKLRRSYIGGDYEHFERVIGAAESEEKIKELSREKLPFYLEALIEDYLKGRLMDLSGVVKGIRDESLAAKIYHAELKLYGLEKRRAKQPVTFEDLKKVGDIALEKIKVLVPDYNGRLAKERGDEDDLRSYLLATNKKEKTDKEVKGYIGSFAEERKQYEEWYNSIESLIESINTEEIKNYINENKEIPEDVRGILWGFVYSSPPKDVNRKTYALDQLKESRKRAEETINESEIERLDLYFMEEQVRGTALILGAKRPDKEAMRNLYRQRMVEIKKHKNLESGWIENREKRVLGSWMRRRKFYREELAKYDAIFGRVCLEPVEI